MTPEEENKQQQQVAATQAQPTSDDYLKQLDELPAFDFVKTTSDWRKTQKPIMDLLMKNYPMPTRQVSPQEEKKMRRAAAISDSLKSLAEMFAYGQGSRIRNDSGKSNTQTTNERLENLQKEYEQNILRYNTAKGNAEMQDFNTYLQQSMAADGQKRKNLLYRAEQAYKNEQARAKAATESAKTAEQIRQFEEKMAETKRSNKAREAISRNNATKSEAKAAEKNTFEIPVPVGTEGAKYDPFTGKYYVRTQMPPDKQATILANLPKGKLNYIIDNKLYNKHSSYTDPSGKLNDDVDAFSDEEILRWYLEHDYPNKTQTITGKVR